MELQLLEGKFKGKEVKVPKVADPYHNPIHANTFCSLKQPDRYIMQPSITCMLST